MEWDIAPMFLAAIFVAVVIPTIMVTTAAVFVLYPIAKRCSALLEAMAGEKERHAQLESIRGNEVQRLGGEMQGLSTEMRQLQDRQDSLESRLGEGRTGAQRPLDE